MDPATVLKTSGEAVSLAAALAKLIAENRGRKDTRLSELLGKLQVDAVRISSDVESTLERLLLRLSELGLMPEVSLDAQIDNLSWYNWLRRSELKKYREDFHAAYRQLTSFIDDATALMLCEHDHVPPGTVPIKTAMFSAARAKKRELDAVLMDPHVTLGSMLDTLLAMSRRVTDELRAG